MNLIVFDLEWNIGYQPKTFLYHGTELTLRGEIIQIGAARINDRGDVLDTFEVNLRPRIFRKLQHHIAKVTGLSQGDLDAGLPMKEGLQKFLDWAGDDAELAEWGLDDVPVLKQNLFLVGLDENWPNHWYDLQRIFLQAYPRKEGEGLTLESVVDRLGIPKEEPFHNALDDALYTARVCRKLPLAEGLATYPTEEELLTEALLGSEKTDCDVQLFMNRLEHDDYRNLPELYKVNCPECGAPRIKCQPFRQKAFEICVNPTCPTNYEPDLKVGECKVCAEAGRHGDLIAHKSEKSGKRFIRCTNYDDCGVSYPLPARGKLEATGETCPECGAPIVVVNTARGPWRICVNMDCPTKEKKPARGRKTTTKASTAKKTTAAKKTAAKKTTAKKTTAKKSTTKKTAADK